MLVDYQEVVLRLTQEIASKKSHGQRDLLASIARLEAECAVPESLVERQLRLVVAAIGDHLMPAPSRPRVDGRDGTDDSPRAARDTTVQEDTHGSSNSEARTRLAA